MIPMITYNNILGEPSLIWKPINLEFRYVLKQNPVSTQFCNKFEYDFIFTLKLIFCILSFYYTSVNARLSYRPISEVCFYGCCIPFLK